MNLFFAAILLVFSMSAPMFAADPRVDQAYDAMAQEAWDEAETAATAALAEAQTDFARFDAHEALATLAYYTQDSADILPDLLALDANAIRLFGRDHRRRIAVLELLGLTYDYLDDPAAAARQFTNLIRIARTSQADIETLLYAQLNLANLYLDEGKVLAAAMLAAELSITAIEVFGPDDEITLEASVIRASAHFAMNHPVETVVHAMPMLTADYDNLIENLPELTDRFAELYAGIMNEAAETGDAEATADRWSEEAKNLIAQREAAALAQDADYEAFSSAIYAKDPVTADIIARRLTTSVLADDPFPVALYNIMIFSHVTAADPANAVPWAKRLAGMPAEYLATQDLDLKGPLGDISLWLAEQGRLPEALDINTLSLTLTSLRHDPNAPALQEVRLERSALLALSRDYAGAATQTERALVENTAFTPADLLLRAKILVEFGQLAIETKEFASAEEHLSEAVALLQSTGRTDDLNWAETLTAFATGLSALGRDDQAISILEQSLAVRKRLTGDHSRSTVTGQITLAAALAKTGQNDSAAAIYKGALQKFRDQSDAGNPLTVALSLGYADLLERTGQTAAADQFFAEAALLSRSSLETRQPFEVVTYQQLADRAAAQGRLDDASTYLDAALEHLPDTDPAVSEIRIQQGRIALEKSELPVALQMFRDATRRLAQPGQGSASYARDYLPAYIETLDRLARKDEARSASYLDEIFLVAQGVNELSAGRALSRAAARWNSEPELAQSLRRLQDIEADITNLRGVFRERLAAGTDAADIRVQLDDQSLKAETVRGDIIQQFPEYSRFAQGKAIDLSTVAAKLLPDEVMVLFATSPSDTSTGESGSIVLALTKDALRVNSTNNRDVLEDLTRKLRCAAALTDTRCGQRTGLTRGAFSLEDVTGEGSLDAFDLELAHQAYLALLGPVADALVGKSRLVVVPDQSLAAMPFHLLVRDAPGSGEELRDAEWLIRDMSLSIAPTVASFDALRSRGRRSGGSSFLGIGDPLIGEQINGPKPFDCEMPPEDSVLAAALDANGTGSYQRGSAIDTEALIRLAALPDTRCELQRAADLFGENSQLLLQGEATETRVKELSASGELEQYRNISFATHGLIAGEVGAFDAGLVLTPPSHPSALDDGLLTTGEIAQLRLDADFVFLSACNTAAGTADNEEGLSGLASAFFYAGARSLLVSHWPVYSDAAARLTTETVTRLNADPTLGVSDALRYAMLDVLDDPESDKRMRHPAFWAPFMIVGEGTTR